MDMAKYIGETTEYDKKQEVERRKVKSWLKSVSAFANGSGGCLLFGIADDDTIIGLTDAKTDAEFISQKIKERIDPMPQIDLKIERVEDKELLILHVHGGEDTPYYYIGDSVLETFVRIGNESVVADSTEHKRLVLRGRNSSFDARPSDEMFEDYAFSKLRSCCPMLTDHRFYLVRAIHKVYSNLKLLSSAVENPVRTASKWLMTLLITSPKKAFIFAVVWLKALMQRHIRAA
jgi:ATP-dependent DNA helicase RecG